MFDDQLVSRYQQGNHRLDLLRDDFPQDPREGGWHDSKMYCWHNHYLLGDEHCYKVPSDFLFDLITDRNDDWDFEELGDLCLDSLLKEITGLYGDDLILMGLYLFDHSGITISTSPFGCPWDSGPVGYIYIIPSEQGVDPSDKEGIARLRAQLEGEVKEYDSFLRGDVYGYRLYELKTCECCGNVTEEAIDSCFGFDADSKDGLIDMTKDCIPEQFQSIFEYEVNISE